MIRLRLSKVLWCLVIVIQLFQMFTIYLLLQENTKVKVARKEIPLVIGKKPTDLTHYPDDVPFTNISHKRKRKVRDFLPTNLTVLLFKQPTDRINEDKFKKQVEKLRLTFQLLITDNDSKESLGVWLNHQLSQVKTEYFLLLESHVSLSIRPEENIAWLWNALEHFAELDFVGGSYLSQGKLHVPCTRYRLCRWVLSESYEYERSLENVMVCDGISASFMGRTDSVKKVKGGFDEKISDLLVVKDFFLRAKNFNVVCGTRPNVMFLVHQFQSLYQLWNTRDITVELVAFAVKHKVFVFQDIDGNKMELCSATSPLSGRGLCIEKNSHKLMLDGGHWAYQGLFTYPYLIRYLEITLLELVDFFDKHNISYFIAGGVSLGSIKTRSILPWEAGDIDIDVYDMDLDKLYNVLKPLADEKGYTVKKYFDTAVHVYCTPQNVGEVSGGLATIHYHNQKAPPDNEFIKIQTNGVWPRYKRDLIPYFMKKYGNNYLVHQLYRRNENIECKIKGHNACLPNFKSLFQGKAGMLKEFFCQV